MQETPQKNRTIMSIIAIVIGLMMAYLIPFLAQTSLERVLEHLIAHIDAGNPAFTSGLKLFDFFYPVWRALIFVAGAALIVISQEIKKGTEWTYPVAITLFAIPSIGGMFMFLPYVSFVDGFPLPLTISMIGLIGYISFILLPKADRVVKWTRLGALTFLGMLSTHAFTIGVGAQRTMATRPGYPLYKDFTWWLFNWAGEANWVAVILLFSAIPLLAVGKRKGWWLAVTGSIAILMINVPTQFIRTKTMDYLYGAILAVGVLIFTMVPYFKKHLLTDENVSE
ncbi:MAG: hypothetical protein KAU23_10550 [Anaerolineales bacterium]|jgi:hypothetical protein|nr:hypothetical protein [Anaerolineales bacterium]